MNVSVEQVGVESESTMSSGRKRASARGEGRTKGKSVNIVNETGGKMVKVKLNEADVCKLKARAKTSGDR